ncbi:hypothetical protein [Streptomyces sp. V4I2]|uniref:hypothetical protein n=1 Tax=Streptomyces sp. V4I2 TaxID=3042280 RepID=UPI00278A29AF|nr:hypothetical protein [Streptomyces sp. V4I2]MDQ1048340.1 hypothetical protein [Streptomyces sp. V4I2]
MQDRDTADAGSANDDASSSFADDLIESVLPDAADTDRRRRNRKVLISVGWVVVSSLVLFLLTKSIDWLTSEHDARVTSEADDKVDREGPAFSASVRQDTEYPEASLYNAPFSDQEKRQILGPRPDLGPFDKAHGARSVFYSDVWHASTRSEWWGYSEAWLADLISDRQAALVINGMRMKGVRCTPAKANTVIITHGEGEGSYSGMLFDVTRSTSTPLITGSDEQHYGEPYFAHKKIDLGNGATPGGLRIQVTSGTKDCTWKAFEVTYVDSDGTHTQDITNNGKHFAVHGIAEHPKQVYEFTVTGMAECGPLERGRYECPGW